MGGHICDLTPSLFRDGIPSTYFYSKKIGSLCGAYAVRSRAKPVRNQVRYLKRHLGQDIVFFEDEEINLTTNGYTISYDQAITEVIQHCIRTANEQLNTQYQETTNLISLSYPAVYTLAQRQRLIELAERATLVDGTHIKVHGTIADPAAAALDYLANNSNGIKETNVLVYDLGGGSFDLTLLTAYPSGKKNKAEHTYYYDIIGTRRLLYVAGTNFDQITFNILAKKFGIPMNPSNRRKLQTLAEPVKIELSSYEEAEPDIVYDEEFISVTVTRKEFENASKGLLKLIINSAKYILQEYPAQKPEFILLTGGASQMPMVQRELEEQIPEYKGKIICYRPIRAVAYGAARFGTLETENPD